MAEQSLDEINAIIQRAKVRYPDLVRDQVKRTIQSSTNHLILEIASYSDNDSTSKELLCLTGTVMSQYEGRRYNTPVEIWLPEDYPVVPPHAYVQPTSDMYISPISRDVQPDGLIILSYLKSWHHPISDLLLLIQDMSKAFSKSPPLFSRISLNPDAIENSTSNMASNNANQQNHTHRFSDMAAETRNMLLPIQGFDKTLLVSLEEAVKPLVSLVPDIEQMVWIAKQNCINPKDGLNSDESASIMVYTMEWEPYNNSFYVALNTALRAVRRDELKPWFSYLRLFIHALDKLPSTRHIVYRGIKRDLTTQCRRGDTVFWWGFSSCTSSIEALNNERFLGKSGIRTLFSIECDLGKNIRSHSFYADEDEILLLPARQFEVIGCLDQGNGLQIVQLRETKPQFPLIKFTSS